MYAGIAGLAAIGGLLYNPLKLRAEVLGLTRPYSSIKNIHGEGLKIIPDTVQCEDLHHHVPSGQLFAACQGKAAERFLWFPPLANFKDRKAADKSKGSIYVIDPKVRTSQSPFEVIPLLTCQAELRIQAFVSGWLLRPLHQPRH